MANLENISGVIYLLMAAFLPPIYIRIIYIFVTRQKYRKLECYRLMAQIGIMQLMVAPITVLGGMRRVFDVDPLNLTEISLKLASISIKVEAILSLVLAMNRLRMICGLKYPDAVHTVIVALSYTYGLGLFVVLMSPWANFRMPTGSFMGRYDFSLPLTYYAALSASSVMLCSTACTFAIYVVIICYLSRLRSQAVIIKHYKRERTILVYAVIRFVTDMTLLILFNFFKLPDEPWVGISIYTAYGLNNLLLSPLLYLSLHKAIRRDFFGMTEIQGKQSSSEKQHKRSCEPRTTMCLVVTGHDYGDDPESRICERSSVI